MNHARTAVIRAPARRPCHVVTVRSPAATGRIWQSPTIASTTAHALSSFCQISTHAAQDAAGQGSFFARQGLLICPSRHHAQISGLPWKIPCRRFVLFIISLPAARYAFHLRRQPSSLPVFLRRLIKLDLPRESLSKPVIPVWLTVILAVVLRGFRRPARISRALPRPSRRHQV